MTNSPPLIPGIVVLEGLLRVMIIIVGSPRFVA